MVVPTRGVGVSQKGQIWNLPLPSLAQKPAHPGGYPVDDIGVQAEIQQQGKQPEHAQVEPECGDQDRSQAFGCRSEMGPAP